MDMITKELVRVAMAKVVIALGYDVSAGKYRRNPNVQMAIKALESLQSSLEGDTEATIDTLGLDSKTTTVLHNAGIETVAELAQMTAVDLMRVDAIGPSRLVEIDAALERAGVRRG
jgi:DNA-directed RNA polymerase alpha subunit